METSHHTKYRTPIIVFALLTIGIVIIGVLYFLAQKKHIITNAENELIAVAEAKTREIAIWKEERLGDARFLFRNKEVAQQVNAEAARSRRPDKPVPAPPWMVAMFANDHYRRLMAVDAAGRVLFGLPPGEQRLEGHVLADIRESLRRREIVFSNVHRNMHDEVGIDIVVPAVRGAGEQPSGAVVMQIDPSREFFPLVQKWMTPSPTAETLLVRQDGDHVLFLNELRHRKDTALNLRLPLSDRDLPAARAVLGHEGIVHGRDYRQVPVIAAVRPVAGTPWYLVAKIDADELLQPLRGQAFITGIAGLALVIGAAGLIVSVWWRRENAYYREKTEEQAKYLGLLREYEVLSRYANDIILKLDREGRIIDANEQAAGVLGLTGSSAGQRMLYELLRPEERQSFPEQWERLLKEKNLRTELVFRTSRGGTLTADVSFRLVDASERPFIGAIVRDITERKGREKEIARLNRIYAVLSKINETIIHAQGSGDLFEKCCSIAVEDGGFRMAWIGLVERNGGMRPLVWSGYEDGFLTAIGDGAGIVARSGQEEEALRPDAVIVSNDIEKDAAGIIRVEEYRKRGYRSIASLPIKKRGAVTEVLHLYAADPQWFHEKELELLHEVAADISFALDTLEDRAALALGEERLRLAMSAANQGLYDLDVVTGEAVVNEDYARMLGYDPAEFTETNAKWVERLHPEDRDRCFAVYRDYVAGRVPEYRAEFRQKTRSGAYVWILSFGKIVERDAQGRPLRMIGIHKDITERKEAEEALRQSEERYRSLLDNMQEGFQIIGYDWRYLYLNDTAARFGRQQKEDMLGRTVMERYPGFESTALFADLSFCMERRESRHAEYSFRFPDGATGWFELIIQPVREGLSILSLDITERRQADALLRESESKYRLLFENMTAAFALHEMIYDAQGRPVDYRFLEVNPAFERLTGLSAARLVGRTVKEAMPAIEQYWIDTYGKVASTGEPIAYQNYAKELGRYYDVWAFSPGRNRFAVVFTDITDKKLAEDALRESEDRYRTLFMNSMDAVMLTVPDGRILSANPAACRMFGRTEEDICAIGRRGLISPDDPRLAKLLEERERTGRASGELTFVRKDGSRFPGEASSLLFKDAHGEIRTSMVIRDITERKRTEDSLRESEQRYRGLFENMVEGFAHCRMIYRNGIPEDFVYLTVNDAFGRLTGLMNVVGKPVSEVIPGIREADPRLFEIYGRVALTGLPERFETFVTALQMWFSISVYSPRKGEFVAVFDVITERKRAEEELLRSRETLERTVEERTRELRKNQTELLNLVAELNRQSAELQQANEKLKDVDRLKSMFIASMSHELRTPLNSVIGFSSVVLQEWKGPLNEEQKQLLQIVLRAGKHLLTLINDVIDVSKIEAGTVDMHPEDVEVSAVIAEAVDLTMKDAKEKGLDITLETEQCSLRTDRRRLLQCLLNLLSNAVKFTPRGRISVRASCPDSRLEIAVSDTGIGMREEDLPRLFKAFVRLDSPLRSTVPGTGLGLYLTKKLAREVLGGDVQALSRQGEGSTFTLILPVTPDVKGNG